MLLDFFCERFAVVDAVIVGYDESGSGSSDVFEKSIEVGMVAEGHQIFFFAGLPGCAVEFPSAYAYSEVVQSYSVSRVHMIEAYVRVLLLLESEGLKLVLEDEFAEAHVVFFADAADVVDIFRDEEWYVDVGVVKDLHDFLNLAVVAEDVNWTLFKSMFN